MKAQVTVVRLTPAEFEDARARLVGYCYGCGAPRTGIGPNDGPVAVDCNAKRPPNATAGGARCGRCGQQAVVGVVRARGEGWVKVAAAVEVAA